MLAAMVIIMVGLLGLLATINLSIQQTTQNLKRELAVGVGEDQMRFMLGKSVDTLRSYVTDSVQVSRPFRGYSTGYTVSRQATALGSNSAEIQVTVNWTQRGVGYQHQIRTIKAP
jgi:type IV pilus assembly protein PilV